MMRITNYHLEIWTRAWYDVLLFLARNHQRELRWREGTREKAKGESEGSRDQGTVQAAQG